MIRKSICKAALFYYMIHPLFYFSAILTVIFVSFRFFLASKFFVIGAGTSDLRYFFSAIPYISIFTIPLLVFRLKDFIKDDSLPVSAASKFVSVSLAAFCAFIIPVILLFSVPVFVSFFGIVDEGQVLSGFLGIFLFSFSAISLIVLLFTFFSSQSFSLIVSFALLLVTNFIDLLPMYLDLGKVAAFLCRKLSFSFAFDSFGKGIIDSRSVFFYIIASFFFLILASISENRRLGKKTPALTKILLVLILIFSSFANERLYFRWDLTKSKLYSVSSVTKNLIEKIDEPLRITYFSSRELTELYPQASDVIEFLKDFSLSGKNISLSVKHISSRDDPKKLLEHGIRGQQVRSDKGTKTEYITVYSAVLIQYLDRNSLIPFAGSIENLEYDLCQRLRTLVFGNERKVWLVLGNGLSPETRYDFVQPWLSVRGFKAEFLSDMNMVQTLDSLTVRDNIVVLGSKFLSSEQCAAIERAVMRGVPSFIATSPYSVDIENGWTVSKNRGDNLIPALTSWGFAFGNSLVQDISCFPLVLESADNNGEYQTVNYPMWVSALPQERMSAGGTFFWPSPLILYNDSKPIVSSSSYAWIQEESDSEERPFLVSPFSVAKSAKEAGKQGGAFVLSATSGSVSGFYQKGVSEAKVTVVSGELFTDSAMTGFISSESSGDFRNFDFVVAELLRLSGDEDIALLMEKNAQSKQLFKITDEQKFNRTRLCVFFVHFLILPSVMILFFVFVQVKRK